MRLFLTRNCDLIFLLTMGTALGIFHTSVYLCLVRARCSSVRWSFSLSLFIPWKPLHEHMAEHQKHLTFSSLSFSLSFLLLLFWLWCKSRLFSGLFSSFSSVGSSRFSALLSQRECEKNPNEKQPQQHPHTKTICFLVFLVSFFLDFVPDPDIGRLGPSDTFTEIIDYARPRYSSSSSFESRW